jgi:hypothetical protein
MDHVILSQRALRQRPRKNYAEDLEQDIGDAEEDDGEIDEDEEDATKRKRRRRASSEDPSDHGED